MSVDIKTYREPLDETIYCDVLGGRAEIVGTIASDYTEVLLRQRRRWQCQSVAECGITSPDQCPYFRQYGPPR